MTTTTSDEGRDGRSSRKTQLRPEEITAVLRAEFGKSIDLHPLSGGLESQARFFETTQPWRLREGHLLAGYQLRIGLENVYQAALARCQTIAREAGLVTRG